VKLQKKGFTLIEILLVVVIIGIMLAVIVPRAWRANIDTKYGLVRQNCAELASFAHQWVEDGLQSQDSEMSEAKSLHYYWSLCGNMGWTTLGDSQDWIAGDGGTANSAWSNVSAGRRLVLGRYMPGSTTPPGLAPEAWVASLVPPEKIIVNPFNGLNVFTSGNYPSSSPVTGAIAAGMALEDADSGYYYVGLVFQGTDSTTTGLTDDTSFHAGMNTDVPGLRNGVFVARIR
jgi:prepilin-type N-terminal cleavage/methylation domain-containing protein